MSYLNLMGNKLKPKEVNDTLESLTNSTPTPEPIEISADDVEYDNTTSHLSATNVQSAIDEVNTKATNAQYGIGLFARETITAEDATSINANASATVYIPFAKTGYTPLSISGFSTGSVDVYCYNQAFTSTAVRLDLHNSSGTAVSVTPNAIVVYMKNQPS